MPAWPPTPARAFGSGWLARLQSGTPAFADGWALPDAAAAHMTTHVTHLLTGMNTSQTSSQEVALRRRKWNQVDTHSLLFHQRQRTLALALALAHLAEMSATEQQQAPPAAAAEKAQEGGLSDVVLTKVRRVRRSTGSGERSHDVSYHCAC